MMENEITFRNAVLEDVDAIANVLLDFYNMEDYNEAKNTFVSEHNKNFHYLVAVDKGEIIGLVTWIMHGLPKHGLFELDRICVLSNARGKGIGKSLIKALINDAGEWYKIMNSKIRKLYLLTHEDNKKAHAFYEKVGFEHETTLKDHYYKNQDERLYTMFLS